MKSLFVKSRLLVILSLRWWILWSKIYNKIVNIFSYNLAWIFYYRNSLDPVKFWNTHCDSVYILKHYGADKWYMLWDVISTPQLFVQNMEGDCDDFACLACETFGDEFSYENSLYSFKGFYALIWSDGSGHAVAMWEDDSNHKKFVVSNNDAFFTDDIDWTHSFDSFSEKRIVWLGEFDYDTKRRLPKYRQLTKMF